MAYTTIDDGSAHFQAQTYTGNNSDGLAITNSGNSNLQPDWLWIKKRSGSGKHVLVDSTRGINKQLFSDGNDAEQTSTKFVASLDSDGFTLNDSSSGSGDTNTTNGGTYVGWQWKANGGTTTSGGSDDTVSTSAHQANTTAGFSVVTYSGTGTQGHTVAHGLGVAPEVIFLKARNKSQNWRVFHHKTASDGTKRLILDQTNAQEDAAFLNDTAPSSTVFTLGASDDAWNASDGTYVAYCFAPIQGYSKFGSYTGNANADGAFVYTGFKPAWVMTKRTDSSQNWAMYDNKRDGINVIDKLLYPNGSDAEVTTGGSLMVDFLSNGFKWRGTSAISNGSGNHIYMAFAEHPFVSSKGVPVTAR